MDSDLVFKEGNLRISFSATIVIPSYNEAKRLPIFLRDLCEIAQNRAEAEIVVSDDGSSLVEFQNIQKVVEDLQKQFPKARLQMRRAEKNAGKGAAIAREFRRSSSDIVGFVDADGSVSAGECFRLMDALWSRNTSGASCSSVIGTRIMMLGNPVTRNARRHYMGRVFATLVSELFHIPVYDTQCGCKFFMRSDLLNVIQFAYDTRWLWDTQVVISLVTAGYSVIEVPLSWHEVAGSKVSLLKDALRMFAGMIRYRIFINRVLRNGELKRLSVNEKSSSELQDSSKKVS